MDLVTIIVPVYNVENYLNRCLDSIIKQSYKNLDIILINDGSTDNSLKICNNYAKSDTRITVINIENSGPSICRNIGLEKAKGSYISFVDSDDYVEKHFIETLLKTQKNTNADVVGCSINVNDVNGDIFDAYNDYELVVYKKNTLIKEYLEDKIAFAVWGKLFTKESLMNQKFLNYRVNEDRMFMWNIFNKINIYTVIGHPLYHYMRRSNNSLTSLEFTDEHLNIFSYIDMVQKKVKKCYPQFTKLSNQYAEKQIKHILTILNSSFSITTIKYKDYINKIKFLLKQNKLNIDINKYIKND